MVYTKHGAPSMAISSETLTTGFWNLFLRDGLTITQVYIYKEERLGPFTDGINSNTQRLLNMSGPQNCAGGDASGYEVSAIVSDGLDADASEKLVEETGCTSVLVEFTSVTSMVLLQPEIGTTSGKRETSSVYAILPFVVDAVNSSNVSAENR
ncbi:hypothetical protein FACUT_13223 [Fusarium acutatum]|uniref:Uncharacterized protein n=1 Tax=Fusarium acutatum TaxID=78861 RepID=A0A8H4J9F1_9HYPO|nr:hypothetical protein FACUT_13223 [Fusarium acutatum]